MDLEFNVVFILLCFYFLSLFKIHIGSSVETRIGLFAIKEIFVHKFNDNIDHCWLIGQRWLSASTVQVEEISYPLITLDINQTKLFNANTITNIAICTHLCSALTFENTEFQNTVRENTRPAFCFVGNKIVHNPHFNVFVKQPYKKN